MQKEAQLQRQVLEYLETTPLVYWRVPLGGVKHGGVLKKNPMAGFPDICGLTIRGVMWGIELKTVRGRTSPVQTEKMYELRSSGALIEICRTYQQAVDFIDTLIG